MRKIIAIMMSLALLLSCVCGLAETAETTTIGKLNVNGEFSIESKLPEGYKLSILSQSELAIIGMLHTEDETKPTVMISIAWSDAWSDVERLNDVTEEDLAAIEATFQEVDNVKFEYTETALGTKLMVVAEAEGTKFVDIYTIYNGYEMEFVMTPGTAGLTEKETKMLVDFITDMTFVATGEIKKD